MTNPKCPQAAIEAIRMINRLTGHGRETSIGASHLCRPSAVKAPSMKTSPCAKLMKRRTP